MNNRAPVGMAFPAGARFRGERDSIHLLFLGNKLSIFLFLSSFNSKIKKFILISKSLKPRVFGQNQPPTFIDITFTKA